MEVRSGKSIIQDFRSLPSKRTNVVTQETSRRRLEPKTDKETAKHLAEKEKLAVEGRSKRKISAVSSTEITDMYLILPSYTEHHQAEINDIIA